MPSFFQPPVPAPDPRRVPLMQAQDPDQTEGQAQDPGCCCSERTATTYSHIAQGLLVCAAFSFGVYECIQAIIHHNEDEGEILGQGNRESHYRSSGNLRGGFNP